MAGVKSGRVGFEQLTNTTIQYLSLAMVALIAEMKPTTGVDANLQPSQHHSPHLAAPLAPWCRGGGLWAQSESLCTPFGWAEGSE